MTDSRFQALMPDPLHWLGITKIDRFISMSNMKCVGRATRVCVVGRVGDEAEARRRAPQV